ncbi:uncharacterized protein LOC143839991 isoform X2 [Paroedura picta]|uniref:uncharacterized protein LOC143839991 isoform X2 n=1 Tax=Paroedura picta TaxID=143630 RepID=UPI004055C238
MVPESLGLWMFLWIQGGVSADDTHGKCKNETGILGKAVELKCCYSGNDLKLNQFRVQWQLKDNTNESQNTTYLPSPTPNSVTNDNKQKIVISCLVAAAVIIMIIIWILFKRQHSHHRAYAAPVGVDMS